MARVSIGVPVHDGERHLAEALDSLLGQTFSDLEIVVCDNASGDGTEEIARRYAAADPRVRYHRQPRNVGAAPNFNQVFALCRGELFKWAAHDDRCRPDFVARCVAALDARPDAVLAYPRTVVIDEESRPIEPYALKLATDAADPVARFRELLRGHKCYEVFGLIRRDALARTDLIGNYSHGDGVLLARLALQGPFVEVPEVLFEARRHEEQSMSQLDDYRRYAVWFDASLAGKALLPYWRLQWELVKSALGAPLPARQRTRCLPPVARWSHRHRRLLWGDLTFHVRRKVKQWFGIDLPGRARRA